MFIVIVVFYFSDVSLLDWEHCEDMMNNFVPDILIGSDIVYDPSIIGPLCKTIKMFFQRNSKLQVYIANINRNEETFATFFKTLGEFLTIKYLNIQFFF